jgi:hypothetical protein
MPRTKRDVFLRISVHENDENFRPLPKALWQWVKVRSPVPGWAVRVDSLLVGLLLVTAFIGGSILLALRDRELPDAGPAVAEHSPSPSTPEARPSAADELLALEDKQAMPADATEEQRVIGHGLKDIPTSELGASTPDMPPPEPKPPETKPPAKPPDSQTSTQHADPPKPPPPPAVSPGPVSPPSRPKADLVFEERLKRSVGDLRKELRTVPELRVLSDVEITAVRDRQAAGGTRPGLGRAAPQVLHYAVNVQLHKDFRRAATREGLPLQSGPKCLLDRTSAGMMQALSKDLREMGFVSVPGVASRVRFPSGRLADARGTDVSGGSAPEKVAAFKEWCDSNHVEKLRGAFPTLLQMLQVEDEPTRLLLVKELEKVKNAATTAALASRAMMDLSPQVREAAVEALRKRPADQYKTLLLKGLRYPWPPVADHAALALVELRPGGVVPQLVKLLDKHDPAKQFTDKTTGKRVVKELVRLNHMRNCLLCHAPSSGPQDGLVRAPVPTPGKPLPPAYYQELNAADWVRADITFLRQDFSVSLKVDHAAPWPDEQRFDFVTRKRKVEPDEASDGAPAPATYPQRDAVLYVLRGLTGKKDVGDASESWRKELDIAAEPLPPPATGKPTPPQAKVPKP